MVDQEQGKSGPGLKLYQIDKKKPDLSNGIRLAQAEQCWLIVYTSLILILTTIPYILGYCYEGTNWRFSGFVFGVEDGNSYIAKMLTGAQGAWLFRTPYTSGTQRGAIAFLPYLLTGKLTAPPGQHEQLVVLFHIFRIAAGSMMIWFTYRFIAFFTDEVRIRRWGTVAATVGGGLGWVLVLFGNPPWLETLPLEFYSPETFGFLSLLGLPHLALARAGLMAGLLVYMNSTGQTWELSQSLRLGGWWLVTALAQPLTALLLGGVIGLHLLFTICVLFLQSRFKTLSRWNRVSLSDWKDQLRTVLVALIWPGPLIIYTTLAFLIDPFLHAWTSQNIILSPHPVQYLLAYGFFLPLVVMGVIKSTYPGQQLVALWVLILPVLVYAPHNLQRRLAEGIWPAIIALAIIGLGEINNSSSRNWRWTYFRIVTLLGLPAAIFLFLGSSGTAIRPQLPAFRPAAEVQAFQFLANQARPDSVVLTAYTTGNAMPAWAPVRVVIGHGPESIDLDRLEVQVQEIYRGGKIDPMVARFISEHQVDYIFWGPAESEYGGPGHMEGENIFEIYNAGGYRIYKVNE